jgi:hypothetical protein
MWKAVSTGQCDQEETKFTDIASSTKQEPMAIALSLAQEAQPFIRQSLVAIRREAEIETEIFRRIYMSVNLLNASKNKQNCSARCCSSPKVLESEFR